MSRKSRHRRYYLKNREMILAKQKARRLAIRKDPKLLEEYLAKGRERIRAWRAKKAKDLVWLAEHRKKESARMKAYYAAHPEKRKEMWRKYADKNGIARRPKERIRHAKKVVLSGRPYSPRFNRRKPDYVPVGASGIDHRSPYLWNNLTDSQRAFARELEIERKYRRQSC